MPVGIYAFHMIIKEKDPSATIPVAAVKLPPGGAADVSPAGEPAVPTELTAEEQMALFEKSLKEEDWGHQPC